MFRWYRKKEREGGVREGEREGGGCERERRGRERERGIKSGLHAWLASKVSVSLYKSLVKGWPGGEKMGVMDHWIV